MHTHPRVAGVSTRGRPRGSLVDPRRISLLIEASADERLNSFADAAGTSRSGLIQWLIERTAADEAGRPVGWKVDHPREEELPIDSP